MNRALFILISVSSVSSLLLIDSAIKGTALLLFAGVVVLFLRRDSAATRHLVWLVAIIAMLAVPLLSAMLPQWRVLPEWANVVDFAEENRNESNGKNGIYDAGLPIHDSHASYDSHDFGAANTLPIDNDLLSPPTEDIHAASNIEPPVTAEIFAAVPTAKATIWTWHHAIASLWFFGFLILIIRLTIARAMLWRTECRSCQSRRHSPSDEVIGPAQANRTATRTSAGDAGTEFHHSESDVYSAFTAACTTLNIRQHVTLLLHPDKTIPVVWGIFRPRLMLPLAAQSWSDEQLRSVLLHELAHIKRRDVLGQLLAQFACALHWFNPLVWFAAWRLHVERERACDDLVLTSGVRASAYAEHLLNVATRLSSSPWTQTCGLAMARNSSLHGRLTAVLSEKQNRRSVTSTSIGVSLLFSVCVAIPIAMLHTASAQPAIAQSKQHIAVWRSDPVAAIVAAWEARQNTFRFAEFNAVEMRVCMPGANVPAALLPGDEIKWGPDFDRTIGLPQREIRDVAPRSMRVDDQQFLDIYASYVIDPETDSGLRMVQSGCSFGNGDCCLQFGGSMHRNIVSMKSSAKSTDMIPFFAFTRPLDTGWGVADKDSMVVQSSDETTGLIRVRAKSREMTVDANRDFVITEIQVLTADDRPYVVAQIKYVQNTSGRWVPSGWGLNELNMAGGLERTYLVSDGEWRYGPEAKDAKFSLPLPSEPGSPPSATADKSIAGATFTTWTHSTTGLHAISPWWWIEMKPRASGTDADKVSANQNEAYLRFGESRDHLISHTYELSQFWSPVSTERFAFTIAKMDGDPVYSDCWLVAESADQKSLQLYQYQLGGIRAAGNSPSLHVWWLGTFTEPEMKQSRSLPR